MTSVQVLSLFFAVATVVTVQARDYPEGNAPEKRNSSDIYDTISISYPWFVAIDVPPDGFVNARMSSPWLGRPEIVCASMDEVQDLSTAILGRRLRQSGSKRLESGWLSDRFSNLEHVGTHIARYKM